LIGSQRAKLYRYFFLPFIFLGAVGALEPIWLLADTLNGLMAVPNLIGILGLSGLIIKLTRDFFSKNYPQKS
jgi:AGCS family alanine or glycine:cation symporter